MKWLERLYNNHLDKLASRSTEFEQQFIDKSPTFGKHLLSAQAAISRFKNSPRADQNLRDLFMILHLSITHCTDGLHDFAKGRNVDPAIIRDLIHFEMFKKICDSIKPHCEDSDV